jgi:hypothetical protein
MSEAVGKKAGLKSSAQKINKYKKKKKKQKKINSLRTKPNFWGDDI